MKGQHTFATIMLPPCLPMTKNNKNPIRFLAWWQFSSFFSNFPGTAAENIFYLLILSASLPSSSQCYQSGREKKNILKKINNDKALLEAKKKKKKMYALS